MACTAKAFVGALYSQAVRDSISEAFLHADCSLSMNRDLKQQETLFDLTFSLDKQISPPSSNLMIRREFSHPPCGNTT